MQWVLFILVVYKIINEQLLSASMDIVCGVYGGFVQVKDADYISCQNSIVLVQNISSFISFYHFITFHCQKYLAVKGDQTTTDTYISQLGPIYNQGTIQSS